MTEEQLLERLIVEAGKCSVAQHDRDRAIRAGERAVKTISDLKDDLASVSKTTVHAEDLRRHWVAAEAKTESIVKVLRDLSEAVSEFIGSRKKGPKARREAMLDLAQANEEAFSIFTGEQPF